MKEELEQGRRQGESVPAIESMDWIKSRQIRVPEYLDLIPDLGKGEASVLALAVELGRDALVVIDDKLGREMAKAHEIRITGTAGILLKAKQSGRIDAVGSCLDELARCGFRLSQRVREDVLTIAGEI
ncbi:MAG: DUF3368 domain-containing protein [Kiritimatiellae bacterium]|nr:DUF3368 domain-containing protein [Kiritimatiellia bacterium]